MSFLKVFNVSLALALGIILTATSHTKATQPSPMTPVEMVELKRLSAPALSPNGRYLIYLKSHADWKEDKTIRRYVLLDLQTNKELPVFDSESDESLSQAYWSPDSQGFLTILERETDAKNSDKKQAWYYNLSTGEFSMLTNGSKNIQEVEWAKSGKGFYFRISKESPKIKLPKANRKIIQAIKPYDRREPLEVKFFDIDKRSASSVISGDFFVRSYDISDNGRFLIYTKATGGLSKDRHNAELWVQDLETQEETQVTENKHSESNASLSPNGSKFAYISMVNEKGEGYYEDNLFVASVASKKAELILPKMSMEVLDYSWSENENSIFILGNTGLRSQLYQYDFDSTQLTQLTEGDHVVKNWRYYPKLKTHIFTLDSAKNPGDIYQLNSEGELKRLTDEYAMFNQVKALPKQVAFNWEARDGQALEGLLVYPVNYGQGELFPLITITHGGPRSSSQFGAWNVSRSVSVFSGQGYGVFLPNHRGGTGYGDAFMRDMVGKYFRNAHTDVLSGIDALVDAGLADPNQLIKQGWSAGGHMVNKLITETERFVAASSGAGVADWASMYGESDVRHYRTFNFGGTPWEKRAPIKTYQKQSPLYQSHKITTPTLFWAGEKDVRVPPTQSILMHRATKAAGAETELYLAKGEPHNFRKLSHKLFKINKELAWYARHLGKDVPLPDMPQIKNNELGD